MGFLKKINEISNMVDGAKAKKQELKDLTDKSKRSEEDIKCIKKSNAWSTLNLLLIVGYGFALYFLLHMIFTELFLGVIIGIAILTSLLLLSIRKAIAYADDNAPSLGAHLYAKFNFFLMVTVAVLVILGTIMFG